jgi:hypothetical protein
VGDVPAGAVHEDHGMGVRGHGLAEFIQHRLHGGGADRGQDQGNPGVARGTDGAEQIDGLMAQIAHAARADPTFEPAAADAAGLADPVGAPGRPPRSPLGASRPSRNQISIRLASGWSRASASISAGNFF